MYIGICDDNLEDRNIICHTCKSVAENMNIDCSIFEFRDGQTLITFNQKLDLLILDIEMPGVGGIEVKNYLGKIKSKTIIIFVSGHPELAMSAFGINVYGFVEKSQLDKKLEYILKDAMQLIYDDVIIDGGTESRNIMYIKAEQSYTTLYMNNGTRKLIRTPLNDLQEQLKHVGFIRVHKSCIVNMEYIDNIVSDRIIIGDETIHISARLKSTVKKEYAKFKEKNARFI